MSVGKNIGHDSGVSHVTGKSIFVDDRPEYGQELFVGVVTSPIAKGKLKNINISKAKAHEDFVGMISAKDLATNRWGTIVHEQPILVEDKIAYRDEAICLVASCKRESVEELISLVELEVEKETPVSSISQAKEQESMIYKAPSAFVRGDVNNALKSAPHTLKGVFRCGGQEHFYMESQACVAYPLEKGQIEVHSSSQHPSETQRVVSEALGIPLHHVVCIVKRMGGGFGGKESQAAPIAAYAAIVAQKFGRPARCILTKDQDMKITGKRHPFENEYEVGFNEQGEILALKVDLASDGGAYADLSSSILERGMFHTDGAYYLENVAITGTCYRTNNHPNTAFRGFGGPQGNFTIESLFEDIALFLGKDSYDIRRKNIYEGNRNMTPYGQVFENNMLPALFDQLHESTLYKERVEEVKRFNAQKNGQVKGLSFTATKFGIAFTARFLNQANALVNLHLDATVQVSTGATEMGQGVNTKIAQTVSYAFGILCDDVQVMPTSTEKNHNTSPTAASSGADLNCAATLDACNKIKAKLTSVAKLMFAGNKFDELVEFEIGKGELDPNYVFEDKKIIEKNSKKELLLKDVISACYLNRISLAGYSHFKTPNLGFCKERVEGKAFNYFSQGVALTEVIVDEYTGMSKILKTDILMDLGRRINPGIDQGQVTGAFVQGAGWVTTENLFYDDGLALISHSPTTYKIPNIQDTPREFNVAFIENNDNDSSVFRSKAVGEPPFILGISVWTAIKNALSYRAPKGELVQLDSPATCEEILMELTRLKS